MPIQVRRGTTGDLGTVAALHRASILELCGSHHSLAQLTAWTSALRPAAYEKLLRTRALFVATDPDVVRGFGALDLDARIINATYVSPTAVGRGIGRALMEAMERAAREHGVQQLTLHSTLNAVPFYETMGFTRGGLSTNRLPSGACLPCVVMRKNLPRIPSREAP